jgi:hypothetical protein
MAYTVDYTNGTKTAIVVSNSAVDTTTNIGLVGRGYTGFGEIVAEDLLHMLENFASGSAPSKPIEGQIWFDSATTSLKYFDNTVANSGNWKAIANMSVQSNAPTSVGETDGHFWLDDDTGMLYIYYNGSWISFSDVAGDSRVVARTRNATDGFQYRTIETIVNGEIVSIQSAVDVDPNGWTPQNDGGAQTEYLEDGVTLLDTEFPLVRQGINLNIGDDYVFHGTATKALYADLAERYEADAEYTYGTVVKIGGDKEITQTDGEFCPDVFGVVSDKPAFAMNEGAGTKKTHPYVALAGRVPVKVVGKVTKGERLVSSSVPGHAMSAGDSAGVDWQYVIGRALESKIIDDPGIVEVVVGTK